MTVLAIAISIGAVGPASAGLTDKLLGTCTHTMGFSPSDCPDDGGGGGGPDDGGSSAGLNVTVGYVGDIAWCNTYVTNDAWKDRVTAAFNNLEAIIEEKTDVDLKFAWGRCFTTPGTYHHEEGNYAHDNGDGDDELEHPYPFNRVPDDHQISECVEPKDETTHPESYLNAEQGILHTHSDGSDHWHAAENVSGLNHYDDFGGVFAFRYDAEQLHGLSPHADMIQLLHDENFNGGDTSSNHYGQACLPTSFDGEEGSAVREPSLDNARNGVDIGPIHEMGHTFNAYHCDSASTDDTGTTHTIMASHDNGECPKNTTFDHVTEFSGDAANAIDSWAPNTYG